MIQIRLKQAANILTGQAAVVSSAGLPECASALLQIAENLIGMSEEIAFQGEIETDVCRDDDRLEKKYG